MITVLMGMYNTKEEELRSSIESILNQTYKDYEFLIINDACTDNSRKIVLEYNDSRIRLVDNEMNLGLEKTLNLGLKLAKGEYIARMDTDDISVPERLEKQKEFLDNNKQYSFVGSRVNVFDEIGVYNKSKVYGEIQKNDLLWGTPFTHPSLMIRKHDIIKAGGYPLYRRCEDYAMEMNMYAQGYKGYIMPEYLLNYRMTSDGYKKKKYKYRVIEAKVKLKYFRKMKIEWYKYFYVIKPLIVGLIPHSILKKIHKGKE